MNRFLRLLLPLGCVFLLGTASVAAQTTAQINGTVVDESGAALPGVAVAALHTETRFRRDTVTDTTGSYTLTNLPIGPYRLEASLSGFRTYVQTGSATTAMVAADRCNIVVDALRYFAVIFRFEK